MFLEYSNFLLFSHRLLKATIMMWTLCCNHVVFQSILTLPKLKAVFSLHQRFFIRVLKTYFLLKKVLGDIFPPVEVLLVLYLHFYHTHFIVHAFVLLVH